MADTPEKLAHLQTLPQHKVFPTRKDGKTIYVYADASECKCLYAGSQADFQNYAAIEVRQEQANAARAAAEDAEMAQAEAQMQWDTWGPWRRPIVY